MSLIEQYDRDGYIIVPDLIPHSKIDHLVSCLEQFKQGGRPYWSESIHKWIKPPLDKHGFMTESMENFTRLWFSKGLNKAGNDIVLGPEINGILKKLKPEREKFVHWLNHFFDRSTGSIDHVDNWYLDTDPAGDLIGAWVALEDIHPDSGTFRLFPGTHKRPGMLDMWSLDHDTFVKKCAALCETLEPMPVVIKKGTVAFFHPLLLHGATDQRDERRSRKSVTAHYLPYGCLRKERFEQAEPPEVRLQREMRQARTIGDYPITVSHSFRDEFEFNTRGVASYLKSLVFGQTPIVMDMKRRSWSNR